MAHQNDTANWRSDAACRYTDPEAFFPDVTTDQGTIKHALAICAICDVADACLLSALEVETAVTAVHGIRGGLTEGARRKLLRNKRRSAEDSVAA